MPTRRSHHKSRRGCTTCKSRRVKCDEQGPPCGSCRSRGTECEYATNAEVPVEEPPSFAAPLKGTSYEHETEFEKESRLLGKYWKIQVQLMHRWSAHTFESFCRDTGSDREACRFKVPQLALDHDFLLHAVLAAAAFDLTINSLSEKLDNDRRQLYLQAGLCHKYMSIRGFRAALATIDDDNHEAMLHCSAILMVLSIASIQLPSQSGEKESVVDKILDHVQLLRGINVVYKANPEFLMEKNVMLQNFTPFEDLPESTLDDPTLNVLGSLKDWNNARDTAAGPFEARHRSVSHKAACEKALFWLREFLAKCVDVTTHAYLFGWPDVAGDDYLTAVRERDRIALAILSLWGTTLERAKCKAWWVHQLSPLLMEEVSDIALQAEDERATAVMTEIGDWLGVSMSSSQDTEMDDQKDVLPDCSKPVAKLYAPSILTRSVFGNHGG